MVRIKRLILCLAALLLCAAMACADTLFVTTQNEETVNMHSGAGTEYEILLRIPNGYGVETDEALDPDRWMLCTCEEQQGYISGQYLSEVPGAINGYEVSGCMATVKPSKTGGYVNFREKPSTNEKVLYRCHEGDELIELRSNGTWSLVYDTNSCDRGFIQSRFLEYGEPLALADIAFLLADTASMIPPAEKGSAPSSSGSTGASLSGAAPVQCDLCGGWYEEGNVFRNHICSGAEEPAELVQCDLCGGWYEAGNVFRNHICSGAEEPAELVQCDLCGGWYEADNVFRNHICSGAEEPAVLVQCERCGGWYEEGNVFRNHICSGAEEPAELVQCDLCGGWYEAGNVFRNHICSGAEEPAELVQCERCGGWYEEGNVFRNHICSGAN